MNKFSRYFYCYISLLILTCQTNSFALVSRHHKKHTTSRVSQNNQTEPTSHGRRSKHHISSKSRLTHKHIAAKPRYAYPVGIFLMEPPTFDSSPLSEELNDKIRKAFYNGYASDYPTRSLVKVGLASYYPMRGGIFWRREPIKYIIMHSTEPGIPVGAKTIIDGWSHGGRRHAGAHYVIDRDGTIYQAVDPDLATVHINIFKTLPGINNDNSVGIEMCHTGSQDYPPALVESAARLAAYLQSHYHVAEANIITHCYAQQGDHTDPVHFNWDNFIAQKNTFLNQGINQKLALMKTEALNWHPIVEQPAIMVVNKKPSTLQSKADLDKTASPTPTAVPKPAVSKLVPSEPLTDYKVEPKSEYKTQSAFEAKFGPINETTTKPSFEMKVNSASKPFNNAQTNIQNESANKSITQPASPAKIEPLRKSPPELTFDEAKASTIIQPLTNIQTPSGTQSNTAAAPLPSAETDRLLPVTTVNRLVPFSTVINTQRSNNNNQPASPASPSAGQNIPTNSQLVPVSNNNNPGQKSKRLLPLRGPIDMDMDPDDAASLLNQ